LDEFDDLLPYVSFVGRALARIAYLRFALEDLAAQWFRNTQSERKRI